MDLTPGVQMHEGEKGGHMASKKGMGTALIGALTALGAVTIWGWLPEGITAPIQAGASAAWKGVWWAIKPQTPGQWIFTTLALLLGGVLGWRLRGWKDSH